VPDLDVGKSETNPAASEKLSAAEDAYFRIREMIVTGALSPGQIINEKVLVQALESGRTPVREALQRLANQHIVAIFPRRGLAVAKLSLSDVQAVFEARETIEAKTAKLAAVRRSEDEAQALLALGEQLSGVTEDEDFSTFLDADQRLHHLIASAAHNVFLAESADHLLMLSDWIWHQYFQIQGSNPSSYFDHGSIIQAIVEHDAKCAASMMREHVQQSREVIRNTM
jgi:DNA-binding GntR family transcriptional regulator